MSAEPTKGHLLNVAKGTDWTEDDHEWNWSITCLAPEKCGGWQECGKEHRLEGVSAADGPYDNDCPGWHGPYLADDAHDKRMQAESAQHYPWCDEDEFEFHGVLHTWRYGYGWTIPFDGCAVAANLSWADEAWDIADEHGEGSHVVDDDWDDTDLTLIYVRTLAGDAV